MLPAVAAVPDARLTVSDVSVDPDRPTTDEPTTVTATVSLSLGSDSPVELDRIVLEDDDGDRLARAENPGSLSSGDDVTVDLVTEFDDAGRHDLTLVARGTDSSGQTVEVERPVTVIVEDSPPQIDVDATLVEGVTSTVAVGLANPSVDDVRNVEVALIRDDTTIDSASLPTLAAGERESLNVSVVPEAETESLDVRISYTTATGDRQHTVRHEEFRVEELRDDVEVDVRPIRDEDVDADVDAGLGGLIGGGGDGLQTQTAGDGDAERVEVAVTNFGNTQVSEAVVEPSGEEALARQFIGEIAPGETATATLDLSAVPPGELDVEVRYQLDREERIAATTYDHRPATAAVSVTDVDMTHDGDRVTITGNAGNIGETSVTGVVVAVGEDDGVHPAYPQRNYFVGTVDGSEFAPFELTARLDDNATDVPIEVTYRVDGREVVERTELPVETDDGDERGLFGWVSARNLGVALGVSALIGAGVLVPLYYRQRQR